MSAAAQITVEEADSRLGELLDRVERGEEITIARAGRLVAAPPAHDVGAARAAVEALFALREELRKSGTPPVTVDEIIEDIHAGHKY